MLLACSQHTNDTATLEKPLTLECKLIFAFSPGGKERTTHFARLQMESHFVAIQCECDLIAVAGCAIS